MNSLQGLADGDLKSIGAATICTYAREIRKRKRMAAVPCLAFSASIILTELLARIVFATPLIVSPQLFRQSLWKLLALCRLAGCDGRRMPGSTNQGNS